MSVKKSVRVGGLYFSSRKEAAEYYNVSLSSVYRDMKKRGVSFASALNKTRHASKRRGKTQKDRERNEIKTQVKRLKNELDIIDEAGGILKQKYRKSLEKELQKASKMAKPGKKGQAAPYSSKQLQTELTKLKGIKKTDIQKEMYAVKEYKHGKGWTGKKVKTNFKTLYKMRQQVIKEHRRVLVGLDGLMQKVLSDAIERKENAYGGYYEQESEELESTVEELSLAYSEHRSELTDDEIGRIETLLDPIEAILYDSDGDSGGMLIDVSDEIYQILTGNHMPGGSSTTM